MKNRIWLADLTHTGQSIASDTVPAAIGMIAEAIADKCPQVDDIQLFKFPDDLSRALDKGPPEILGLSNYVWNFRLSSRIAEIIKQKYPEVIIVMGGPNFPTIPSEQKIVLEANPWIDFFIVKEGELALIKLINQLIGARYDVHSIDFSLTPNLVTLQEGIFFSSAKLERVYNLNDIPSPYLTGRLDPFLDGKLMPVIQTNRGCPFACAFCTEGQGFWNKVRKKSREVIREEIRYISKAFSTLSSRERRGDLLIADSNFGMFSGDLDTCDVIREMQETVNYPTYINVATGKNKKELVLECARRVNGAMKLAGSVQSLDPLVQQHMKRSNISADEIVSLALQASEIGTNTYSEVILALPEDSKEKHYNTLRALVEADFSTISMYQLMLLPGTEFGELSVKNRYAMTVRHRVIPRAFGTYTVLGKVFSIAEIEDICVANNTLSYSDYLQCRRLNLVVNIFFNDRLFHETLQVLRWAGLSIFELLVIIAERRNNDKFEKMIDLFLEETEKELWEDKASLEAFVADPTNVKKFVEGSLGSNLIFKFKALSITSFFQTVCETFVENILFVSSKSGFDSKSNLVKLLIDTVAYKRLQVEGIFLDDLERRGSFSFPINSLEELMAGFTPNSIEPMGCRSMVFRHNKVQRDTIAAYKGIFGDDINGMGRILARTRITELYRIPTLESDFYVNKCEDALHI